MKNGLNFFFNFLGFFFLKFTHNKKLFTFYSPVYAFHLTHIFIYTFIQP